MFKLIQRHKFFKVANLNFIILLYSILNYGINPHRIM